VAENELVLLRRFVENNDAEAFSKIMQRHAPLVYGTCLRVLDDKTNVADVVQETFIQLLRDAGKISGSLPAWLHRVATHKAIDAVRRDARRRKREERYAAQKPLQTTRWQDMSLFVDKELENIDEQTRQILIRHFLDGRTASEIANDMAISQPTVSRRIESGLAELRQRLRNRGILVAAAALASLLAENAVQAAPAAIIKELGKIAIVGAKAAVTSGIGTGAAAGATGAKAAVTGTVLTGVKAKLIAAAAVAAVGIGTVVTYRQVTSPAGQPEPPADFAQPTAQPRPAPSRAQGNLPTKKPPINTPSVSGPKEAKAALGGAVAGKNVETSEPAQGTGKYPNPTLTVTTLLAADDGGVNFYRLRYQTR